MLPIQDTHPSSRFPVWTVVIILVNIYVFYLELTSPIPDDFILQYSLIPNQVTPQNLNSLMPFITSQFLHGGFLHIISNMLFLWVFGNNIERTFGAFFFPLFYLASGVAAGFTQYFITPTSSIPMLGASGAVAGVLGAYFALFPNNKIKTLVFIFIFVTVLNVPAYLLLFFWFITQFFNGVASISLNPNVGGIAFLPHIGGFLFGWFIALVLFSKRIVARLKFLG